MLAGSGLSITGAASTITRDNLPKNIVVISDNVGKIAHSSVSIDDLQTIPGGTLTPNKVVISDSNGKFSTSAISTTEVGHLSGVNNPLQTQIDSKAPQATTYSKNEVDFRLLFKQDVLVTSPSNGAKVWDDSLKQVRNILGVDGISTSIFVDSANPSNPQNNALIISGAGISGGLDPNYITLANDVITHHKDTTVGALTANSIGVSMGGSIMCFGNITAAFGGIMYANSGLEATTINCSGVATIDALTVNQNINCAGKLIINSLDAISFDGSNNCVLHRPCLFPSGFTSAGVCGFQNTVVMDEVQMNSLTTPAINIQMSGLASHISVNDVSRISFTQLDTQIHGDVSTTGSLTCSNDLLLNSKLKINSLDAMSFDGSNNCVLHRPCQFPSGFTSAGVCGFQNTVVMDDVQMNSLTTPAINIQMSGLASHILVNDVSRISFTQLDTQIHGDVSITGNLTVSGTGGGGSNVDLSPYQKHASSHLQAVGCEAQTGLANVALHPYPSGWDTLLDWGGGAFQKVCNNVHVAGKRQRYC